MSEIQILSRKPNKVVKLLAKPPHSVQKTFVNQPTVLKFIQLVLVDRYHIKGGFCQNNINLTYRSNLLVTITPYIQHDQLHLQEDDYLQANTGHIIQQIICKIFKADPLFMYSYENIFFSPQTNSIQFNKLSMAGLIPILLKTKFHKEEFAQVYELLDESMFEQKQIKNRKELITVQTKFRAIGMMILHLIFKKRISLLLQKDLPAKSDYVQFNQAFELVKRRRQKFALFLSMPQSKQQICRAEKRDSINYLYFLQRVFIQNRSMQFFQNKLDWKQTFDTLLPNLKMQQQKRNRCPQIQKHNKKLIQKGQLQYQRLLQKSFISSFFKQMGIYDSFLFYLFQKDSQNLKYQSIAQQIIVQKSSTQDYQSLLRQFNCIVEQKHQSNKHQRKDQNSEQSQINQEKQKQSIYHNSFNQKVEEFEIRLEQTENSTTNQEGVSIICDTCKFLLKQKKFCADQKFQTINRYSNLA